MIIKFTTLILWSFDWLHQLEIHISTFESQLSALLLKLSYHNHQSENRWLSFDLLLPVVVKLQVTWAHKHVSNLLLPHRQLQYPFVAPKHNLVFRFLYLSLWLCPSRLFTEIHLWVSFFPPQNWLWQVPVVSSFIHLIFQLPVDVWVALLLVQISKLKSIPLDCQSLNVYQHESFVILDGHLCVLLNAIHSHRFNSIHRLVLIDS